MPTRTATLPAVAAPIAGLSPPGQASTEQAVGKARRGLAIYLTCVIVGSAAVEFAMLRNGSTIAAQGVLVALLMWIPGVASVVARLALREGFRDVAFRMGGRSGLKSLAVGWGFPVAVGVAVYSVAWVAGLAEIAPPQPDYFPRVSSLAIKFALSLVLGLTLLTLVGTLTAAGEEIGWRGYMLTRLVDARLPRPVLLSGLIWAAWHLPLVLSGQYAAGPWPALSGLLFILVVVPFAYLLARLRRSPEVSGRRLFPTRRGMRSSSVRSARSRLDRWRVCGPVSQAS